MVQKNNMPSSSSANTNSTSLFEEETVCPIPTDKNAASNGSEVIEDQPRRVRYNWDAKQKGQVLGSYFIGYTVTQLPGAWAGRRYGHIKILTISFFTAGLLTCLLPYVMLQLRDDAAVKFFIFMRVLVGFLQGCCYPTFMALWGSWAPKSELSRLVSIQFAGAGIGIAIMYPVNGWLAVELGWQFIFYFTGTIAMIFSGALGYCCCDTPAEHDTISQEELTLIMSDKKETSNERHVIPWKSILTSVPIWAIVIAHTAGNFGTYVMTSYMPSYLDEQLHYNIKSAAIFCKFFFIRLLKTIFSRDSSADKTSHDNDFRSFVRLPCNAHENENNCRKKDYVHGWSLHRRILDCTSRPCRLQRCGNSFSSLNLAII